MISEYCKICNLFNTCEKSKTCSCNDFVTNETIHIQHYRKYNINFYNKYI